jgi:membrane protein insertase Oxa1/YidC/SpoIIIJ
MMQNYTLYFFPVLTVMILAALPSAVGLYWMTTTIFAIGQNYLFFKKNKIQ